MVYYSFMLKLSLFFTVIWYSFWESSQKTVLPNERKSNQTLKFVYVVLRHGSRAPVITYPKDPYPFYDVNYWPYGPESLTKLGRDQMFRVGVHLRNTYDEFLGRLYYPSLLQIEYNRYHIRLFQSGSCMAASLFPPEGKQKWHNNFPWQPVYMTTMPFDILELPKPQGNCPAFAEESQRQMNIMDEQSDQHIDLLTQISEGTGMNVSKLSQIHYIYSTLLYDIDNGHKLPEWAQNIFPDKMRPFYVQYLIAKFASTSKLLKLGAGHELRHINTLLNSTSNQQNQSALRMFVEVTHDNTIISLLRVMGNTNPSEEILLGAFIVYELHSADTGFVVKVFYYRNSETVVPEQINISTCPDPCTLDDFNKFVNSNSHEDWNEACHNV